MIFLINKYLNFKIFNFISYRIMFSLLTSFFVNLFIGPYIISYFKKLQKFQIIRTNGPIEHLKKNKTPTMGGILIIISICLSVFLYCDLCNIYIWYVMSIILGYGLIGFLDDYKKIKFNNSSGLKILYKFFWLSIIAILIIYIMYINRENKINIELIIPFYRKAIVKINYFYIFLSYFVMVGTSNSVNLTDGLDGLAIMPVILISFGLGLISFLSSEIYLSNYINVFYSKQANELSVLCASIVGSGLGFLWFNTYPAKIFMGDVGSLSLGGALGIISILLHQELLLIIMGGIFVMETISVILQIFYFKFKKKRIFKMAPIHHHYEIKGLSETLITIRFWIISFILLLIGIISLRMHNAI
ncbi:phospho-N-acetylmuramoyl-pentapeptide-transferase [Buchnera aphidicola]|uniref:Phospho-N-acetylmuramoyl-pentapeptide-transferase n=1 Tax=Buchnera aphidicola (Aphis gossypii) TaxID=98785 RepID=A0A5J6ZD12_9GAMM|nr:phospho-N-acetylmuramoyl-pentapeptide-transferase [Buchnera aphidicola]QFQ32061.1 phospho-N-acetylmuramoyl-pentapeptide-transferase [Buchnera aphidicola (Aphis gossypii)]UPT14588.1 phospho-N-acetylmuramoyl-pentapeptide-transferase [Buchnera aphidicola (Aphis gossypii)]